MISRSFRAETMIEALEQVKNDLGSDARVVTARQVPGGEPWQVWRKPMFEVVAVKLEPGEEASSLVAGKSPEKPEEKQTSARPDLSKKDPVLLKQTKATTAPVAPRSPVTQVVHASEKAPQEPETLAPKAAVATQDVVEIKGKKVRSQQADDERLNLLHQLGQVETLKDDVQVVQVPPAGLTHETSPVNRSSITLDLKSPAVLPVEDAWPELQKIFDHLLQQGLDAGLTRRVCQTSADTLGVQTAMDSKKLEKYIRRQMEAHVKVQLETARKEPQVVCVVGPSGAGKTSFCAKLAVRYRKEIHGSVAWVCADTVRTGGIAEARAFTEAINIPLHVAYSPQECAAIVQSLAGTDLIIIDTPACNPRNEESIVETGALLTAVPDRRTWLVVPATSKEVDLVNTVAAFAVFKPRALVVTKMDETNSFGAVYNMALRTQLPLAYFSSGARVLDDIHPAAASRLVEALFLERFG